MRYSLMPPVRASMRAAKSTIRRPCAAAALSAAVLAAGLAAGCAWPTPVTTAPPSPPAPPDAPHVITSLSQLSSSDTETTALSTAARVLKSDPSRDEKLAALGQAADQDRPSTLRRLFLDDPASPRYVETMIPHTQERLLNAKAAEYPNFASLMLAQLLTEMTKQEKKKPIVTLELPEELKPVIVTAVLDGRGQLRELIYRQHSGLAAVDTFVIAACKASLWANNMPKGALSEDGTYRLRIEAQLSKYSADRDGNQTFVTRVGLGIL